MDQDHLRLATVTALRQEIQNRSSMQHMLMSLSLTGSGLVGGIALDKSGDRDILLIIPLLSPLIGLLYLDHGPRTIDS